VPKLVLISEDTVVGLPEDYFVEAMKQAENHQYSQDEPDE
jgi:hypothetical protein